MNKVFFSALTLLAISSHFTFANEYSERALTNTTYSKLLAYDGFEAIEPNNLDIVRVTPIDNPAHIGNKIAKITFNYPKNAICGTRQVKRSNGKLVNQGIILVKHYVTAFFDETKFKADGWERKKCGFESNKFPIVLVYHYYKNNKNTSSSGWNTYFSLIQDPLLNNTFYVQVREHVDKINSINRNGKTMLKFPVTAFFNTKEQNPTAEFPFFFTNSKVKEIPFNFVDLPKLTSIKLSKSTKVTKYVPALSFLGKVEGVFDPSIDTSELSYSIINSGFFFIKNRNELYTRRAINESDNGQVKARISVKSLENSLGSKDLTFNISIPGNGGGNGGSGGDDGSASGATWSNQGSDFLGGASGFDNYTTSKEKGSVAFIDLSKTSLKWLDKYVHYLIDKRISVMVIDAVEADIDQLNEIYPKLIAAEAPQPYSNLEVLFNKHGITGYPAVLEQNYVWQVR